MKTIKEFCKAVVYDKIKGSVKQEFEIFLEKIGHKNKDSARRNFKKYLSDANRRS